MFVYLLLENREKGALAVFAACGLTDGLDGLLARRLRQRTLVGAYLDPIADKLLMATAFIVLSYVKIVPLWLTVLVISRDLFILVGSTLYLMLIDATDIRSDGAQQAEYRGADPDGRLFHGVRGLPRNVALPSGRRIVRPPRRWSSGCAP